ncbi:coiled-coil domain-containing protein 142 [Pseudophryne corroboree]|uniref:coiled-coil domain-containing protein 142 n=1 Tax=Pseudophryne corroboree TaxID=495146 RepID=UPI0030815AA0
MLQRSGEEHDGPGRSGDAPPPHIPPPMRREMSHQFTYRWSDSSPGSPVQLQRVTPDVIDDSVKPPIPQPAGGTLTVLDQVYPDLWHRVSVRRGTQSLLFLTRQRQLLSLTRDLVVHQMNVLKYMNDVQVILQQRPPRPPQLRAACVALQDVCRQSISLRRRFRGDRRLYPILPSLQDAVRNMHRLLALMSAKAAIVSEKLVVSVLRRVAHCPAEVTGDLGYCLAMYNQVLADMSKCVGPWAGPQPLSAHMTLQLIAEERGRALAGLLCHTLCQCGLEEIVKRETQNQQSGRSGVSSAFPCPAADLTQGASAARGDEKLEALVRLDRRQVAPVLQILDSSDQNMWTVIPSSSESSLYKQYCTHLWPVLCSHIFQAFYPGMRTQLPGLSSCAEDTRVAAVRFLCDSLTSDGLPGHCQSLGRSLCYLLLCTGVFIAWDCAFSQALSSALTDKCAAPVSADGEQDPQTHSRTCGFLVTVCRQLSGLLHRMSSCHPGSILYADSTQYAVLSRCVVSLQLCDLWIRSRTQTYTSSGSLSPLVLVTYGDLRVITEESRCLAGAGGNVAWRPLSHRLYVKMRSVQEALEGLIVSVTHLLGAVCTRRARDIFQQVMPAGRHWRGKLVDGPELSPSEYALVAISAVVAPVLDGVLALSLDEQVSAVSAALSALMEAWMGHILRERLKFSLQGALQLRCDFESVRELLRSRESVMSPEVVQAALSLPVFLQADNAIVCLLQQPSHKSYLQAGSCPVFCCPPLCRAAVESVSDSLQSLDSLERRAWARTYSAHLPRHSHDSYLPHNQRQWLSLRIHKSWTGLSLPWEGRETSDG